MSDFNVFYPESYFNSRDVIDRIEDLRQEWIDATDTDETGDEFIDPMDLVMSEDDWAHGLGTDGAAEMVALLAVKAEGRNFEDWEHGLTFVSDYHFKDYARSMAEDCGMIDPESSMANYIDWDAWARDVRMDYSSVEIAGVTYWAR